MKITFRLNYRKALDLLLELLVILAIITFLLGCMNLIIHSYGPVSLLRVNKQEVVKIKG